MVLLDLDVLGFLRIWMGFQDLDLDLVFQDLDIVCCSTIQRWQEFNRLETLFDGAFSFVVEWIKTSGFRIFFTKMGMGLFIST